MSEAVRLRVKDVDFAMKLIVVRDGKGGKDRSTLLPQSLVSDLRAQIGKVDALHRQELEAGVGAVYLLKRVAEWLQLTTAC